MKLPNLFRRLFAEGAFSVSFVPIFNAELENHGRDAALVFAERALAVMVAVLLPFTVLALAFMPQVIAVIAPGFADEPERLAYAIEFTRITFPYLLMMALVALMGGGAEQRRPVRALRRRADPVQPDPDRQPAGADAAGRDAGPCAELRGRRGGRGAAGVSWPGPARARASGCAWSRRG